MVYIDESGDEGFSFKPGCSEWFVLSGVVVRNSSDLEVVKLVDEVREQLNKPDRKPLHFRDLKHQQRLPYIQRISSARLRVLSVFVHKPTILEPETFDERHRLYFYTSRYLLDDCPGYAKHIAERMKATGPPRSSSPTGRACPTKR